MRRLKDYRLLVLIFVGLFFLGLAVNSDWLPDRGLRTLPAGGSPSLVVKPVSAQEVYPLFECPCCGKSIDQCTCPMAKERRAFVDGLISGEIAEEEAVMAYIKKYGLESFADKDREEEFKGKLIREAPADRPVIVVDHDFFDFGDISQKEGVATTSFEIKNEGRSDLVINRLESSCGCTSAAVIFQGQEGPRFAMPGHGINERIKDWQVTLAPGQVAELKVYYDPNVHKDFRGTATRTVSIFSNDPVNFEKRVTLELKQID